MGEESSRRKSLSMAKGRMSWNSIAVGQGTFLTTLPGENWILVEQLISDDLCLLYGIALCLTLLR
jgi:hypothetical protein